MVNIFQYSVGFSLAMGLNKPLLDPLHNVVLEGAFDNLVEEVGGNHFVDISAREMSGKRL